MTDHPAYGTSTHTAGGPVRLAGDRLGPVLTEHDSDYRGVHHRVGIAGGAVPNPPATPVTVTSSWPEPGPQKAGGRAGLGVTGGPAARREWGHGDV